MNSLEFIDKARRGVTGKELIEFNACLNLSNKDWSFIIGISSSTFSVYLKGNKTFDPKKSERILLIKRLFTIGELTFGSITNFKKWMNLENNFIYGKTPKNLLNTYSGIQLIEMELRKL